MMEGVREREHEINKKVFVEMKRNSLRSFFPFPYSFPPFSFSIQPNFSTLASHSHGISIFLFPFPFLFSSF